MITLLYTKIQHFRLEIQWLKFFKLTTDSSQGAKKRPNRHNVTFATWKSARSDRCFECSIWLPCYIPKFSTSGWKSSDLYCLNWPQNLLRAPQNGPIGKISHMPRGNQHVQIGFSNVAYDYLVIYQNSALQVGNPVTYIVKTGSRTFSGRLKTAQPAQFRICNVEISRCTSVF